MKPAQIAILLAAAVAAGALGLVAGSRVSESPAASGPPAIRIGDPAPALVLGDLDDRPRPLADFLGRPLLVNFWASWCGPCIEEMPMLDAFSARQGPNGVQVVGIALDEPDAVRAFLAGTPVSYPILLDIAGPSDSSVRLGNARGVLPYTVLLDAQGRVAAWKVGQFTAPELERFVAP